MLADKSAKVKPALNGKSHLRGFVPPHLRALDPANIVDAEEERGAALREDAMAVDIDNTVYWMQVREAAQAKMKSAGRPSRPDGASGTEFLAESDNEPDFRIGEIWQTGCNVMLVAQFKAGKTTLRNNVIRSLADGDDFLGVYAVEPPPGITGVLDLELSRKTSRKWLQDQGIQNTDAFRIWHLRGLGRSFAITDEEVRREWAQEIRAAGISILILDCLRPALMACGLEETNAGASEFLAAWEGFLAEAGVSESLVLHHMGFGAERARSASVLLDWPDVTWKLVRAGQEEGNGADSPRAARYFSAYGRDVDAEEFRLSFDADSRHLAYEGGSRKADQRTEDEEKALAFIKKNPGCNAGSIKDLLGGKHDRSPGIVRTLEKQGDICIHPRGVAKTHWPEGQCPDTAKCPSAAPERTSVRGTSGAKADVAGRGRNDS